MNFLDRVGSHPEVFILGCLVWVPVAIWAISLIGWAVQGDIDAITLVIGLGAVFCLGYFTTRPPDPRLAPVFFCVVAGSIVVFPFVRRAMNRHALTALDTEAAARAYEVLRQSPQNIGARMKLARVLFHKGLTGHAVALAETTLKGLPRTTFRDDFMEMERWRGQVKNAVREFSCLNCGTMNSAGEVYCQRCRAPLMLDLIRGSWARTGVGRKFVAAWILGILVFVGIPSSAMLGSTGLAVALIAGQVVLGALVAWVGLKERTA
ncbi:MAG: tetratricopeptide repeat protein [Fimbriimonadaceae bacterium]|nr:tetratricopeptide repeat protein [Fimbriimonadaceae bacterium]